MIDELPERDIIAAERKQRLKAGLEEARGKARAAHEPGGKPPGPIRPTGPGGEPPG